MRCLSRRSGNSNGLLEVVVVVLLLRMLDEADLVALQHPIIHRVRLLLLLLLPPQATPSKLLHRLLLGPKKVPRRLGVV